MTSRDSASTVDGRFAAKSCRPSAALLLVAAALWATVILTEHLIVGAPQTNSAGYLLASGALVLIGNKLAFSLLFWQFDGGGPLARAEETLGTRTSPSHNRSTRTWRLPGGGPGPRHRPGGQRLLVAG